MVAVWSVSVRTCCWTVQVAALSEHVSYSRGSAPATARPTASWFAIVRPRMADGQRCSAAASPLPAPHRRSSRIARFRGAPAAPSARKACVQQEQGGRAPPSGDGGGPVAASSACRLCSNRCGLPSQTHRRIQILFSAKKPDHGRVRAGGVSHERGSLSDQL